MGGGSCGHSRGSVMVVGKWMCIASWILYLKEFSSLHKISPGKLVPSREKQWPAFMMCSQSAEFGCFTSVCSLKPKP